MEAATPIATTVEATATVAAAAVETAATVAPAAVGTSTTTTVTTAMLGESRDRQTNEHERSETCEKRLQQGGFPHINTSTDTTVGCPRRQATCTNFTPIWNPIPDRKLLK